MKADSIRRAVAGWVQSHLLTAPSTGIRRRALCGLRSVLVSEGDPSVHFEFAGLPLRLPLSHDLPLLRAQFPLYSDNLMRLTRAMADKYEDLAVVDIGANVGDSVALIRSAAPVPILCVEGDPRYLEFLRANTASLPQVSIAPLFVAATTGELPASIEAARGTGRLKVSETSIDGAPSVPTMSLDSLLAEYPLDGRMKLLKSDTDGFEAAILMGASKSLEQLRPALFFEYDPYLLGENGVDGLDLFDSLVAAGYTSALLYDNRGDLLLAVALNERRHLQEIHSYFSGRRSERYLDVAAFHAEDADVFESFRARELDFFRTARGGNGA